VEWLSLTIERRQIFHCLPGKGEDYGFDSLTSQLGVMCSGN